LQFSFPIREGIFTMSLKLHVFPPSPRAFKVLPVAHHLGIDYELCLVDLTKTAVRRWQADLKALPAWGRAVALRG
jgi:glutathione S-transferase